MDFTLSEVSELILLGVMAYSMSPKIMCEEVAWLERGSEPAYTQAQRVFDRKTLSYSQVKTYLIWQIDTR